MAWKGPSSVTGPPSLDSCASLVLCCPSVEKSGLFPSQGGGEVESTKSDFSKASGSPLSQASKQSKRRRRISHATALALCSAGLKNSGRGRVGFMGSQSRLEALLGGGGIYWAPVWLSASICPRTLLQARRGSGQACRVRKGARKGRGQRRCQSRLGWPTSQTGGDEWAGLLHASCSDPKCIDFGIDPIDFRAVCFRHRFFEASTLFR